jgi:C_GCAxxG_C_C family probable redox protein
MLITEASNPVARAEALFLEGYACSQAVLVAFASRLGLAEDVAAGVASAFGGGMARNGWTCGALTGALMAVGLHAGNRTADGVARKDDAYARANDLVARFVREHGATDCRRLVVYDIGDPVQREQATAAGVFKTVCPRLVRTAAAFVAETLDVPSVG